MATTYTSPAVTNVDHVRRLTRDTGTTAATAHLTDEEIQDFIDDQIASGVALKFFAAADCLQAIIGKFSLAGEGVAEETVDDVKVKFGLGGDVSTVKEMRERVKELRRMGQKKQRAASTRSRLIVSMGPDASAANP